MLIDSRCGCFCLSNALSYGTTMPVMVSRLLSPKMPRTVPTFAWRSYREHLDALDERRRRSIVRNSRKCCFKSATCVLPALAPICGKPFCEALAQFDLRRCQLAFQPHDLEHGLRLGLTERHEPIDFARLHRGGSTRDRRLGHQDAAAILLVGTLQP